MVASIGTICLHNKHSIEGAWSTWQANEKQDEAYAGCKGLQV